MTNPKTQNSLIEDYLTKQEAGYYLYNFDPETEA